VVVDRPLKPVVAGLFQANVLYISTGSHDIARL